MNKFDSPALRSQSEDYPKEWLGKVPSRVVMKKTVRSEMPFQFDPMPMLAMEGKEYDAYVNSHGALCAIFPDGKMLGLKPGEFYITAWHIQDGDIIQITNEEHDWYPCLMIVEEVKSWGVQAVALIPKARKEIALAYFRIVYGDFAVVGHAQVTNEPPDEEK